MSERHRNRAERGVSIAFRLADGLGLDNWANDFDHHQMSQLPFGLLTVWDRRLRQTAEALDLPRLNCLSAC